MNESPQQQEVARLKARYDEMVTDPEKQDSARILFLAIADRSINLLPGNQVPMFPPPQPPVEPTC